MYFLGGCFIAWPAAMFIGRSAQTSRGGVPIVPTQRWIHNWPNVHPMRSTWRMYRRWVAYTLIVGGTLVAQSWHTRSYMRNDFYSRPDLKPKAAMVNSQNTYDEIAYQQVLEQNYWRHAAAKDQNKSVLKRLFNPSDADFSPKSNLYRDRPGHFNFQTETGQFPNFSHNYSDHTNN